MADEKSVKIPGGASPRFDAILGERAGVPCERGQVPAHPHSGPGLPGFDPVSPEYARVPERKEDSQGYPPSGLFAGENCPASEDLAEVSRTPVQPPRVGSYGGSPHAADPADAPRPVDTGLGQPVRMHPPEQGDSCRVVDVTCQSSSWPPLPASRSDYVDRNRCLQGRVGRPPTQLGGLRALVKSLGQATHQLARASSSLANPEAFPTSVAGHCCGCHFRQFHHGCLYQQGGRDPVPVSVPSGTGRLGMVQATRHLSCGQPPVRGQERPPTEWTLHNAVTRAIFQRWPTPHVDLFASEKNHKLPVFFSIRPSPSSSGVNALTQNWECLYGYAYPPTALVPSVAEVEASTDGAVLAQPAVVPPTDVDADRSAAGDLPEGRSPEECGHGDAVPQTGGDEVNCMASVRKSFVDRGFSANVADTAARARRESTRRVYGSRLRHYQRWCVDRGVDPVKAPLTEVRNFWKTCGQSGIR